MSTTIPAVNGPVISHGVLIDLTLNGTTYRISNCYKTIRYNNLDYTALAGFLSISDIQNNITSSSEEIQLGLSAIPSVYIEEILGQPIKGGSIVIYRAFFDYNTEEVLVGEIYPRFNGIITNFSVQEDTNIDGQTADISHTITIMASNVMGVLENRISGRRTNRQDYQYNWGEAYFTTAILTDPSMNRVESLHNSSFDFGRKYTAPATNTTGAQSQGD